MVIHLVVDIVYFENGNKHIGYEAIVMLGKDSKLPLLSFINDSKWEFILIIAFIISFIFLSWKFHQKYFHYEEGLKKKYLFTEAFVTVFILIIFIRGGIQASPLRPSYAIISKSAFINNLALNGVITSFYDFRSNPISPFHEMKYEESAIIVRDAISYPGAEFINPIYPLLRKTTPLKNGKKPNIILVIQESWSGKFIKGIGSGIEDGIEVTPHYNQLVKEGILFTRFFATGGRTSNGLLAILTGIPDGTGLSAVHSTLSMATFSGLGDLLREAGYKTLFVSGSNLDFENLSLHIKKWGFDRILSQEDISSWTKNKTGIWGYSDNDVYDVVNDISSNYTDKKPFAIVVLTISTHYPYDLPDKKFDVFKSSNRDYKFLNAYRYSDWAIANYINKAKREPYFNNTVFMFVADHSHHHFLNYYEDRNIPFLIYAPALLKPQINNQIGTQLDIIPTILGLIDHEFYFAAMGKNLLAKQKNKSAYFAYGNLFGWIEENDFAFINIDTNDKIVHNETNPPFKNNNNCIINPIACKENEVKAKAFLNLGYYLMDKDKIFPTLK